VEFPTFNPVTVRLGRHEDCYLKRKEEKTLDNCMKEETIQERIEKIEDELKRLKLELAQSKKKISNANDHSREPKIGDRVRILNPRKGQEKEGIVFLGKETNYVSVQTKKGKVVRHQSNIAVIK
jgi:predicted  nucleic acid-binding Zn-ribbon protein